MYKHKFQSTLFAAFLFLSAFPVIAQKVSEPKTINEDWSKPYPPFRIVGNVYYVGTYDLSCYLITTSKGNILINTGLAASAAQIEKSIQVLGFKLADIKILLTTQAHFDHVGAMAAIKEKTGAQLMADESDAAALADGDKSDYAFGRNELTFKPVKADRLLHDGDTIRLGDMELVMLHHPGHTKGSCSYLFTAKDEQKSYRVFIANMPSIITDKPFAAIPAYPGIAQDYAHTFQSMKNVSFDIWLSSHAGQFNMHDKHKPGDAYNPAAFADREGYAAALSNLQQQYEEKLKKDAESK